MDAATALDDFSLLAPSPTAATTGSLPPIHGAGRKACQSPGLCWKSLVFPFERVTGTSTASAEDPNWARRTPVASTYFCVGQVKK